MRIPVECIPNAEADRGLDPSPIPPIPFPLQVAVLECCGPSPIAQLPRFLEENKQLERQRGRLNSSLFAKDDILKLFDHISEEASGYDLRLVEITPPVAELLELNRQATDANTPQFLNITLHFQGNFVNFGQYVSTLEEKPYFRAVNSCVVRGGQTIQPAVDLSVSFKALIGTVEEG